MMTVIRKIYLSVIFIVSSLSLGILFLGAVFLLIYAAGDDSNPGVLLIWVRENFVLFLCLSLLMSFKDVYIDGLRITKNLFRKICGAKN
jgi:hypothetical protein